MLLHMRDAKHMQYKVVHGSMALPCRARLLSGDKEKKEVEKIEDWFKNTTEIPGTLALVATWGTCSWQQDFIYMGGGGAKGGICPPPPPWIPSAPPPLDFDFILLQSLVVDATPP